MNVLGHSDLTDLDNDDSVYSDQQKGANGQLSSLFNLILYVPSLGRVVRIQAFLQRKMSYVYIDDQDVKDLSEEQYFYEIWENDGYYCWYQLRDIKKGLLGIG